MDWHAAPSPLAYFATLVRDDEAFPLLEAAVSLAQDEYPTLDVQQVLAEVDQMLASLRRRLAADAPAAHRLRMLNHFFFRELRFAGNIRAYHDPANSYLNQVLLTRRGIPISLAVIWLELAQGVGLRAHGVSFPGHFLVKVNLPQGQVLIDPFTGESLSREELSTRLEPYLRHHGWPAGEAMPLGAFLQAARPREIVGRMLRNLKEIHRASEDWPRLLAVQERLLVLLPQAWEEYRDRGLTRVELGQVAQAIGDMETYLAHAPDEADLHDIADRVAALRRTLYS